MSKVIARVVSSTARSRAGAQLAASLHGSRAAFFALLADRALAG